ncbi:hypothetical protein WB44_01260 [Synechococcus sp. WH 8020]|uniref:hypothetical protein n=1 Tax=Synechococcus sp. (strain WH8020) TaxID=32052 RepID=UPI0006527748|nr:hypothetical protein [Synechococcus sp. WH 8020]AKN59981.1 hypothetical protein WB44_01260 [Synechococcus sp. WH 8020]
MNISEFRTSLLQGDYSFVEAIETKDFQELVRCDPDFYSELDQTLRWRLLYGLWVVLLDFQDAEQSPWQPENLEIPETPGNQTLNLAHVLQALGAAELDLEMIDWTEEVSDLLSSRQQEEFDAALHSKACTELVEQQIKAGLDRILACDFSFEIPSASAKQLRLLMRGVMGLLSWLEDHPPYRVRPNQSKR